jgi:hypothetical protein
MTTAHNHAFDMLQEPTGYKWNMDFALESIDVVQVIMEMGELFKMVHWWSTLATGSLGWRSLL